MAVKTAQQAHTDTTLIMARLFNAPKPWKTVVPLLALCLACGLLVEPSLAGLTTYGLLVFALPALLGAALTKPLAHVPGGTDPPRAPRPPPLPHRADSSGRDGLHIPKSPRQEPALDPRAARLGARLPVDRRPRGLDAGDRRPGGGALRGVPR